MNDYVVLFALYGGLRSIPVSADSEEEAIEKAKSENGFLPVKFKKCVKREERRSNP